MSLFVGANNVRSLFVGADPVQAVYQGENLIWAPPPNINFPGAWNGGEATAVWVATPSQFSSDTALFTASYQQTRAFITFLNVSGTFQAVYIGGNIRTIDYVALDENTDYNLVMDVTVAETDGIGGLSVSLAPNGVGFASGTTSNVFPSQGTGRITIPFTTNGGGPVGVRITHAAYLDAGGVGQSVGKGRTYRVTQAFLEYA